MSAVTEQLVIREKQEGHKYQLFITRISSRLGKFKTVSETSSDVCNFFEI